MKTDQIAGKTWRAIWQSVVIIILAAVTGLLVNQARSDTLQLVADGSPEARLTTDTGNSMVVSLDEARNLCLDKKAIFLNARPPEDYAQGAEPCRQGEKDHGKGDNLLFAVSVGQGTEDDLKNAEGDHIGRDQ